MCALAVQSLFHHYFYTLDYLILAFKWKYQPVSVFFRQSKCRHCTTPSHERMPPAPFPRPLLVGTREERSLISSNACSSVHFAPKSSRFRTLVRLLRRIRSGRKLDSVQEWYAWRDESLQIWVRLNDASHTDGTFSFLFNDFLFSSIQSAFSVLDALNVWCSIVILYEKLG